MNTTTNGPAGSGFGAISCGIQVYVAIVLTVLCLLELLHRTHPTCVPKGAEIEADGSIVNLQFGSDHRYMSLDHQFDELWHFENSSTLFIPDPILDTTEPVDAAISMFHQLHCLSSFRKALQKASEGQQVAFDWHEDKHWPHCLDYLRKTILCFADDTLELPAIVSGQRADHIDGTQDIRRCRPSKPLFEKQREAIQSAGHTTRSEKPVLGF